MRIPEKNPVGKKTVFKVIFYISRKTDRKMGDLSPFFRKKRTCKSRRSCYNKEECIMAEIGSAVNKPEQGEIFYVSSVTAGFGLV